MIQLPSKSTERVPVASATVPVTSRHRLLILAMSTLKAVWKGYRHFCQYPTGLVGLLIVATFVFLAFFGEYLAPYPFTEFHLTETLQPPSARYWFGTDQYGRDIFSRVIVGSRDILLMASLTTGLGLLLGITVGLVAGYRGGLVDEILMRAMDVTLAFPTLLLALLILSTLGTGLINLTISIGVVFMPRVARVVRTVVLGINTQEYIEAAHAVGAPTQRILLRHILPNATGPIIVEGSIRFSYAILISASLSFLGLGVQPPAPDWGLQVSEGRNLILTAPGVIIFPSLAISLLVVGVNLLVRGLAKAIGLDQTI